MTDTPSHQITGVLHGIVTGTRHIERLHYAAFLPKGFGGLPQVSSLNPRAINDGAIDKMLRLFGLNHAADEQVQLWEGRILEVHRSFQTLEEAARLRAKGRSLRVRRLVLDLEVGGVFYAAVDDHGWIFAATLNQQAMNRGWAEQQFVDLCRAVGGILNHRQAALLEVGR